MNVICNNCGGADFYNLSNQPFLNPFMWSCIFANDMINLINHYDSINFNNIEVTRLTDNIASANNYIYDNDKKICGIIVDNIFTVYFTHYIFNPVYKIPTKIGPDICYFRNFEYVYTKYNERICRMLKCNENPIFVIIAFKRHGWNNETINKLLTLNPTHKVILITNINCLTTKKIFDIIYEPLLDKKPEDLPITYIKKYFKRINECLQ